MKLVLSMLLLNLSFMSQAQSFDLYIRPVMGGEEIVVPGKSIRINHSDSLRITALKFYLCNFGFWKNGRIILAEENCHLLDLEEETSLRLSIPAEKKIQFDSLCFDLGVDSLTTVAGAMGGDLDPTRGMFWSWQSGYINLKLEGYSSLCPAPAGFFEFHLGGYLPPFQSLRRVILPIPVAQKVQLNFDLAPFFEKIDWQKRTSIMSPGVAAMELMDALAVCFRPALD
jgi:hypothetical protein